MTLWLKQSTAATVVLGPFIDDTDGKTAEAAVAITDSNTFLSKNGGAFAAKNETTHPSHDSNPGGHYLVALDTTDTNTLGRLRIAVHIAGALPVWQDYMIVPANVYDSLILGSASDLLDVSVVQWNGTAVHTPGTAGVPEVAIHDQATVLVDAIFDEVVTSGHTTAGSAGKLLGDNLNAPVATVDTVVDGLATTLGVAGAGLTAVPWNAAWDAEVQSEVNDELVLQNLDHLLKTATAGVDMTTEVTDGSVISRIISSSDTSTFVPATHSLVIMATDVGAVHTHVGTIDGHITADYGSTEKAAIDLLDDADGGLGDIHTVVNGIETHVHTTDGHITADYGSTEKAAIDLLDDADGGLGDIHTVVNGIETHAHNIDTQVGTAGAGLTAVPWNASWDAEVQSEVNDELVLQNLDHLLKTATAGADMTTEVADNTIMARILANGDTSAFDPSTDGLQLIRDKLPTNLEDLSVTDTTGLVAVADSQKVDVNTIKTKGVTVDSGGTTFPASVASQATLGTPTALDGGAATLAGMLVKMADDNAGATFDATYDSLNKIKASVTAGVAAALQANANTETTGVLVSGTYASTYLSNGVYWITRPTSPADGNGNGLDVYLAFTAVAGQYINSVTIRGYYNGNAARNVNVYAYNWVTPGWDQLSDSTTRMNHATTNQLYTFTLLSAHQKADGTVHIRFASTSTTTGDRLNIDQCLVNVATAGASAADIAEAVKQKLIVNFYEAGVWIDTVSGVAGTTLGTNGTPTNPVSNYDDAYTLATTLGVKRFYLKPDSSITLSHSHANWRFIGKGLIALGGQAIDDAIFEDSEQISGVSTGDDATFINCQIRTSTIGAALFVDCGFDGTLTLLASKNYTMHHCYDANPSTATQPIITFAGSNNVGLRNWTGGVELASMAATDYLTADGAGRIVIGATCSANPNGTITIRGPWAACTDNVSGGFKGTITDTARWSEDQSIASIGSGGITAASIATGAIDADALAADAVDEILNEVVEGTVTVRQSLMVLLAAMSGKASGGGTTTITFRDSTDAKDRITLTVDGSGNRSASVLDVTAT